MEKCLHPFIYVNSLLFGETTVLTSLRKVLIDTMFAMANIEGAVATARIRMLASTCNIHIRSKMLFSWLRTTIMITTWLTDL